MNKLKHQRAISLIITILMVFLCAFSINAMGGYSVKAKATSEAPEATPSSPVTEDTSTKPSIPDDETTQTPAPEDNTTETSDTESAATEPSSSSEYPSSNEAPSSQPPEGSQNSSTSESLEATPYTIPSTGTINLYKYASSKKIPYIPEWDIHNTNTAPHRSLFMTVISGGTPYVVYCLDYGLKSSSGTSVSSSNLNNIGAAQSAQLRAALTFGYNQPVSEANCTNVVKAKFGATQALVYCIRAGIFGTPAMTSTANTYLSCFADEKTATSFFNSLVQKVSHYAKIPGFTGSSSDKAPTHKLAWNPDKGRYEKKVTLESDLVGLCNFTNENGITIEGNGTTLTMWSKDPIPLRQVLSGERNDLGVRGSAVYYWNGKGNFQKLGSIDLTSPLGYTAFYYAVQTELPTMEIEKRDADTEDMVPNTTFQISAIKDIKTPDGVTQIAAGTVVQEVTTGENGRITTSPLYPGTYQVQETQPAQGYSVNFETKDIQLNYQNEPTETATMINQPTKVRIRKIAKEKEDKLSGVTFQIRPKQLPEESTDENQSSNQPESISKKEIGELVIDFSKPQEYTTDENGEIIISYLPTGTYEIQETKTLPGYLLDETIYEVTVDDHGLIDGKSEKELVIANDFTKVQVEKNDFVTGKPLKDATLLIEDSKGMEIEQWATDGTPHYMEKLIPGTYLLKEITAPQGYEKAEQVEFQVKETGDIQVVEMLDKPIPTKSGNIKTGDSMGGAALGCLAIMFLSGGVLTYMIGRRHKRLGSI